MLSIWDIFGTYLSPSGVARIPVLCMRLRRGKIARKVAQWIRGKHFTPIFSRTSYNPSHCTSGRTIPSRLLLDYFLVQQSSLLANVKSQHWSWHNFHELTVQGKLRWICEKSDTWEAHLVYFYTPNSDTISHGSDRDILRNCSTSRKAQIFPIRISPWTPSTRWKWGPQQGRAQVTLSRSQATQWRWISHGKVTIRLTVEERWSSKFRGRQLE